MSKEVLAKSQAPNAAHASKQTTDAQPALTQTRRALRDRAWAFEEAIRAASRPRNAAVSRTFMASLQISFTVAGSTSDAVNRPRPLTSATTIIPGLMRQKYRQRCKPTCFTDTCPMAVWERSSAILPKLGPAVFHPRSDRSSATTAESAIDQVTLHSSDCRSISAPRTFLDSNGLKKV